MATEIIKTVDPNILIERTYVERTIDLNDLYNQRGVLQSLISYAETKLVELNQFDVSNPAYYLVEQEINNFQNQIGIDSAQLILINEIIENLSDDSWQEDTNFKISFGLENLTDMLQDKPQMINYVNSLTVYKKPGYRYFYVNFFNPGEKELIEGYGGIVTPKLNNLA